MKNENINEKLELLAALLRRLGQATSRSELATILVNDLIRIAPIEQICFGTRIGSRVRIAAVTNVVRFDPGSSYRFWIEHFLKMSNIKHNNKISVSDFSGDKEMWTRHSPPFSLTLADPIFSGSNFIACFSRAPLSDFDVFLIKTAFTNAAHETLRAYATFKFNIGGRLRKSIFIGLCALVVFSLPIRIKVTTPAEVVSSHPFVVTAPFQSVIARVPVIPSQKITTETILVELDERELRGDMEVTKERHNAAKSDLERLKRLSFSDPTNRDKIITAESLVRTTAAELAFAEQRLQKVHLKSSINGIAILANPEQLIGKPVTTGERILEVADLHNVEVGFFAPLSDTFIFLQKNLDLWFYPAESPWRGHKAKLHYCEYAPTLDTRGVPGNKCRATFLDENVAAFGTNGILVAKGADVTVVSYLLRKPMYFLRSVLAF